MSHEADDKKTRKEGLDDARKEALRRVQSEETDVKGKDGVTQVQATAPADEETPAAGEEKPVSQQPASKEAFADEKEAALEADRLQSKGGSPAPGTPHGKEDIKRKRKPVPSADSDDEAPLRTYKKINKDDYEVGNHRGATRANERRETDGSSKGETKPALYLAEYETPGAVMHAAEKVRDAGYTHFDAHTPFPIHGMDRAMGLPDSPLGWIVFFGGLTGVAAAFAMMYWMNGIDYRIVVGGKPPEAIPSMVPILFELMVLFSSFAAVLGMFGLNQIPRHNHPIFESDRFKRMTDDRFFLSVEADDPKFHLEKTRELLERTDPHGIELLEEEVRS